MFVGLIIVAILLVRRRMQKMERVLNGPDSLSPFVIYAANSSSDTSETTALASSSQIVPFRIFGQPFVEARKVRKQSPVDPGLLPIGNTQSEVGTSRPPRRSADIPASVPAAAPEALPQGPQLGDVEQQEIQSAAVRVLLSQLADFVRNDEAGNGGDGHDPHDRPPAYHSQ